MEFSKEMGESLTLKFSELARKYKDEGKETISMAVGEPNFHTPDYIKKATIDAINNNLTKYSSSRGLFPLRDAVVKDLNERFKTDYGASNVLITPGVKSSLHLALASVLLPQDEVIVLSPYYVSYPAIIKIAEPKSKITYIPSLENGRLDLGLISGAFNKNTKVIIVNSPSNPAGIVLNEEEIETIITLAKKYNTYILSDEIYDKLVFDGVEFNSFLGRGVKDLLIYTNGYSKSYAMTGFRIGYTVAPSEVIEKMLKLQQNINTHTATFTQYGALSTYENEPTHLKPYLKDLQYRVNKLDDYIKNSKLFSGNKPESGFFYFVNIKNTGLSSVDFALKLLEETGIVVTPGIGFGEHYDDHVRFSLAVDNDVLDKVIAKLTSFEKQFV